MVLAQHQLFGLAYHLVVELHGFLVTDIHAVGKTVTLLNNRHHAVVDDSAQVALYVIAHQTHTCLLTLADILHFDIELVRDALQTEDTPRGTVVSHLVNEDCPAFSRYQVKFFYSIVHSSSIVTCFCSPEPISFSITVLLSISLPPTIATNGIFLSSA